jgi:hypothetical protein
MPQAADGGGAAVAVEAPSLCPRCATAAVEFDFLQGLAVCQACGHVADEAALVAAPADGAPGGGAFVAARDSGLGAAAAARAPDAVRSARPREPLTLYRRALRDLAARLALPPAAAERAARHLEALVPAAGGAWRRDLLAAAAAYAAVREAGLPLTLLDVAGAAQADVHQLGKHYRAALGVLGLAPPPAAPAALLDRALDALLPPGGGAGGSAGGGGDAAAQQQQRRARVRADAADALAWMEAELVGRPYPQAAAGAALALALDAAGAPGAGARAARVAAAVAVHVDTLERKLAQARRRLLELAPLLPYGGAALTSRTVGAHAPTLFRLARVLRGGGGGGAPATEGVRVPAVVVSRGCRKRVRFDEAERRAAEQGGGGGDDSLALALAADADEALEPGGADALGDAEVAEYLRRPEEVALLAALRDADEAEREGRER